MALPRRIKHPNAIRAIPFQVLRLPTGVTLSAPAATVSPAGPTVNASLSGNTIVVLVGGGVADTLYQIEAQCDASNGERYVGECELLVVDQ